VPTPPQNTNAQPTPEQHGVVPPNPTTDDSKTSTLVEPGKVSGTKVQPAANTTAAPLKKKKTRSKHKRTRT
jgi:hypothetical protein